MTKVFTIKDEDIFSIESLSSSSSNDQEKPEKVIEKLRSEVSIQVSKATKKNLSSKTNIEENLSADVGDSHTYVEEQRIEQNSSSTQSNDVFTIEQQLNELNDENQDGMLETLDSENEFHQRAADKRFEVFKSMILNESHQFSSKNLIYYTSGIILISFVCTIPFSSIPASDLIQSPENWYEILFHAAIMFAICSPSGIFQAGACLNSQYGLLRFH